MTYAYVQDVAAGWENYERMAVAMGDELPEGLIVHAAGPTAFGYRIINVWESREAWERFRSERLRPTIRNLAGDASAEEPKFDDLEIWHVMAR